MAVADASAHDSIDRPSPIALPAIAVVHCWNQVGTWGDRSCPELELHQRCRNCPVYAAVGRSLLDRPARGGELLTWEGLQSTNEVQTTDIDPRDPTGLSRTGSSLRTLVMVFQVGEEWFALEATQLDEVTFPSSVHRIPYRSNAVLEGLVNIRGELHLCISLAALLDLSATVGEEQRFMVLAGQGQPWVARVDAVHGLYVLPSSEMLPPPATISQGINTFTQGIFSWHEHRVNLLDNQLLLRAIQRQAIP